MLSIAGIRAQNTDFAPVGAKWTYSELNFALKVVPHYVEAVEKEFYQGKWCSKLLTSSFDIMPYPTYTYTQNDTVYYFSPGTSQFEMLYDFTAEVGDSWVVGGLPNVNPDNPLPYDSDTITVDSISSLFIGGDTLKVWHIHNTIWYGWGNRIIEKIGNEALFMPIHGFIEAYVWGLRCFETSDQFYQFVPYPCDTTYSTINATQTLYEIGHLVISPNPANDLIQMPWEGPLESLQVFDATGRQMTSGRFQLLEGRLEVPVGHLPPGMYFLSLKARDRVWSGRFVKG
jgi:hypothetical protein